MTITVNRLLEFTRGGVVRTLSSDLVLSKGDQRVQAIDPDTAGRIITLPDFKLLRQGGPHFYIINTSLLHSFDVVSFNSEETFTVAVGKAIALGTFRGVGNKAWFGHLRDFVGTAIGELAP